VGLVDDDGKAPPCCIDGNRFALLGERIDGVSDEREFLDGRDDDRNALGCSPSGPTGHIELIA